MARFAISIVSAALLLPAAFARPFQHPYGVMPGHHHGWAPHARNHDTTSITQKPTHTPTTSITVEPSNTCTTPIGRPFYPPGCSLIDPNCWRPYPTGWTCTPTTASALSSNTDEPTTSMAESTMISTFPSISPSTEMSSSAVLPASSIVSASLSSAMGMPPSGSTGSMLSSSVGSSSTALRVNSSMASILPSETGKPPFSIRPTGTRFGQPPRHSSSVVLPASSNLPASFSFPPRGTGSLPSATGIPPTGIVPTGTGTGIGTATGNGFPFPSASALSVRDLALQKRKAFEGPRHRDFSHFWPQLAAANVQSMDPVTGTAMPTGTGLTSGGLFPTGTGGFASGGMPTGTGMFSSGVMPTGTGIRGRGTGVVTLPIESGIGGPVPTGM